MIVVQQKDFTDITFFMVPQIERYQNKMGVGYGFVGHIITFLMLVYISTWS